MEHRQTSPSSHEEGAAGAAAWIRGCSAVVILAPIIQLNVLGYAATTDVKDIPIAIVDADRSTASRELVHRFESSANFKIVAMPGSTSEIDSYLDRGEAWMALSIPPDYGRKVGVGTARRPSRSSPTARIRTRPAWRWDMRRR